MINTIILVVALIISITAISTFFYFMFVEFAGYTLKSHYYTGKYYGKYYISEDGTDE